MSKKSLLQSLDIAIYENFHFNCNDKHFVTFRSSIQVIPTPSVGEDSDIRVAPVSTTDEEVQQFMLAFGMAVRNPNFNQMATKAAKNLEDLCASVPGLDKDPVACAFLSKVGL